jgi:hypothetical protein
MIKGLLVTAANLFIWACLFASMGEPLTPAQIEANKRRTQDERDLRAIGGVLLLAAFAFVSLASLWWGWVW